MRKMLLTVFAVTTLATVSGCVVAPPYAVYAEPRVEVITLRPAPYYVPSYAPAPYFGWRQHRGFGHRHWD